MNGFADKPEQPRPTTHRRAGRGRRAVTWVTLFSWLFTFALCTTEMVEAGTFSAADSGLESALLGSSDGHQHPLPHQADTCCTLQKIPLPAASASLSTPVYDQLVAVLPLLLILPIILFVPIRTRQRITGPPGRFRHHLLLHSISPNAPPR